MFLTLGNICIETYENGKAVGYDGAIDHICLDVDDIEKTWEEAKAMGLNIIDKEINYLACWANGVRFFNVLGPNKEKVEFGQIL